MFKDSQYFHKHKDLVYRNIHQGLANKGIGAKPGKPEACGESQIWWRQFHCLGSSDCFVKAGFIAVARLICLSICSGFKESPKVIYSISTPEESI